MQYQPSGLEPIDQNWNAMLGTGAPQLCAVLASDTKAYAVGDPAWFETTPAGQYPTVTGIFGGPKPSRADLAAPDLGVIVAVSPGYPQAPLANGAMPTVPAGVKAGLSLVWVLPALRRKFIIVGDSKTPQIGVDNIGRGGVMAELVYSAPKGGRSSVALDGSSFNARWATTLCVEAMAPGMDPAPGAKYLVTFRPR